LFKAHPWHETILPEISTAKTAEMLVKRRATTVKKAGFFHMMLLLKICQKCDVCLGQMVLKSMAAVVAVAAK
jgi:hypothetical protein